jgi:hypothetical protein
MPSPVGHDLGTGEKTMTKGYIPAMVSPDRSVAAVYVKVEQATKTFTQGYFPIIFNPEESMMTLASLREEMGNSDWALYEIDLQEVELVKEEPDEGIQIFEVGETEDHEGENSPENPDSI